VDKSRDPTFDPYSPYPRGHDPYASERRIDAAFRTIGALIVGGLMGCGLVFWIFFRGMMVGEDVATKALADHGFKEAEVVDADYFMVGLRGCDYRDKVKFTVQAVNPAGKRVEMLVCASLTKGATIRSPQW
jgi:hypothetical protein